MFGTKYLYFNGSLKVKNHTTGDVLKIKYPGMGWQGKKDFKAYGYIKNNKGEKKLTFEGKWNEYGSFIDTEGNLKINEKVNENMKDFEKYYYFCEETVDLNNLTPKMLEYLPPTDS